MDWNGNLAEAVAPYMKGSPSSMSWKPLRTCPRKRRKPSNPERCMRRELGLDRVGAVRLRCRREYFDGCARFGRSRPELADVVYSDGAFDLVTDQISLLKNVACCLPSGGLLVGEMGAFGNAESLEDGYAQAIRKHSGDYVCQFCFPKEKRTDVLWRSPDSRLWQ